MKLVKAIKAKQFANKMTHEMKTFFKMYKKERSIPIYKLREYAQLVLSAKPIKDAKMKVLRKGDYYEFELGTTSKIGVRLVVIRLATLKKYLTSKGTDIAIVKFNGVANVRHTGEMNIVNSYTMDIEYSGDIKINSDGNTPVTEKDEITSIVIDMICDGALDTLKRLEW